MPATSHPAPAATETKTEPKPATPKPSTIKIQTPPVTKPEDKKDNMAVLALRQASSEAATKAKAKADDKKEPKGQATEVPVASRAHRGSVAPELPDIAPDSPKSTKRPALVPEQAAVSSANFHADNAEMLGLVGHHRSSRVSTLENADQEKAVHEIRQSISAEPTGNIDALRKEAAEKAKTESIEEAPSPIVDDVAVENKEELMEPNEPKGNAIAEMIATAVAPQEIKSEPKEEEAGAKETEDAKDDTEAGLAPTHKSAE